MQFFVSRTLFKVALFATLTWVCTMVLSAYGQSRFVTQQQFETVIQEQLNPAYELMDWSMVEVKNTTQGPATVEQVTLAIKVRLTEPLYRTNGHRDGKALLEISKPVGDILELQGAAVVVSMGAMSKPTVQLMLSPAVLGGTDLFLSQYPKGRYTIVESGSTATLVPQTAVGTVNQNASTNIPDSLQQLWAIFKNQGEVWGIQNFGEYTGTPVILRDLQLADENTLTGNLEHPYQQLSNPFVLRNVGPNVSMQVKGVQHPLRGIRRAIYSLEVDEAEDVLFARIGPSLALTKERSTSIRDNFTHQLQPWRFGGEISDYAQLGSQLIHLDTFEVINHRWMAWPAAPIANLKDRFWRMINYPLTIRPFGAYAAQDVITQEPAGRIPLQPLGRANEKLWASADLSTYIQLRDGDLWHGSIDWQNNIRIEEKNLTKIGLLNNLEPITWCGQYIYFHNYDATDKPILRIDTETGSFAELAQTKALHLKAQGSPDGRFLFSSDGALTYSAAGAESRLHVFDCLNNQSFSLDATIDERTYVGRLKNPPRAWPIRPHTWLSSSVFLADLGWYDLQNRQRTLHIEAPEVIKALPVQARAITYSHIPGGEYMDVTIQGFALPPDQITRSDRQVLRRFRTHKASGRALELPLEANIKNHDNQNITWIDEHRYVYSRKKGSISEVGTWLYDLRTRQYARLTHFFHNQKIFAENRVVISEAGSAWGTPLYVTNPHLVVPEKNRIVFAVSRGKLDELVSVSLSGDGKLISAVMPTGTKNSSRLRRVHPYPLELPFTRRSDFAATAAVVSDKVAVPTEAEELSQSNTPAKTGETTNSTLREAQEVKKYCYSNHRFRIEYDCECYASAFMKKRKELGLGPSRNQIFLYIRNSCPNIEETRRNEYAQCIQSGAFKNTGGIEQEKYCECYADEWANRLESSSNRASSSAKSQIRLQARLHCRKPAAYQ